MKKYTFILVALFLTGCATSSQFTAIGLRTATGISVGDFRITNALGRVQGQGRFQDGKMQGAWRFFDSSGVKVAEVSYANGVASGPFRTYYSSFARDGLSAAGKLESEGQFQNGNVIGQHIGYAPNGSIFTSAVFITSGAPCVTIGTVEQAKGTVQADIRFIRILEKNIRAAVE